jgi:hypothetical protein
MTFSNKVYVQAQKRCINMETKFMSLMGKNEKEKRRKKGEKNSACFSAERVHFTGPRLFDLCLISTGVF